MITRTLFRPVVAIGALALLAACGSSSSNNSSGAGSATTAAAATTAAPATSAGGANPYVPPTSTGGGGATAATGKTVAVANDPKFGQILVDGKGMSLYLFTTDKGTTTSCTGACAKFWPPAVVSGTATVGTGVDQSKVTTAMQADGTNQLVYNGHLLYTYSKDTAAGQTNGQGVDGTWFLVNPAGDQINSA